MRCLNTSLEPPEAIREAAPYTSKLGLSTTDFASRVKPISVLLSMSGKNWRHRQILFKGSHHFTVTTGRSSGERIDGPNGIVQPG